MKGIFQVRREIYFRSALWIAAIKLSRIIPMSFMNGRMWNIGNNDSQESFFPSLKHSKFQFYLVLLNFTKWWNVIECYDIYLFKQYISNIKGRINISEYSSSILLRSMLFYMDFKIDLHEWKDEERHASSLDGKITTATAFLYRLYLVSLEKFSSRTIEIVGCNSEL